MRKSRDIRGILIGIAHHAFPEPIFYRLLHHMRRQRPRTALSTASDHRRISLQQGVEICIYWSDVPNVGSGPSASLFVLREEILRLDCFGERNGHMHVNPEQQRFASRAPARLYFPESSRAEHIDRAVFEVLANTDAALKSNRLVHVRMFRIDRKALAHAAKQMRIVMRELLERHHPDNSV